MLLKTNEKKLAGCCASFGWKARNTITNKNQHFIMMMGEFCTEKRKKCASLLHSGRLIGVKWTWLTSRCRILSLYLRRHLQRVWVRLIVFFLPFRKKRDDLSLQQLRRQSKPLNARPSAFGAIWDAEPSKVWPSEVSTTLRRPNTHTYFAVWAKKNPVTISVQDLDTSRRIFSSFAGRVLFNFYNTTFSIYIFLEQAFSSFSAHPRRSQTSKKSMSSQLLRISLDLFIRLLQHNPTGLPLELLWHFVPDNLLIFNARSVSALHCSSSFIKNQSENPSRTNVTNRTHHF